MSLLLVAQIFTFAALGAQLLWHGEVKLGLAQLSLAVVQWLIYS